MKKYIIFKKQSKAFPLALSIIVFSFSIQACNKQLQLTPESYWTESTYFTTVNEANMAVLGVYNDLESGSTYGSNFFPIVGDNDESNFGNRAGDDGDISRYNISTANTYLPTYLTTLYNGVQRANMCIDRIPKMNQFTNGTTSEKAKLYRYYGEALALRAIFYFDLVRLFGDVPYTTKFASLVENNNLPRTSRDTIYDHIIADMDSAITYYLPWQSTLQNYEVERISKNGALGLQARICLHAAGYSLRWDLSNDNSTCAMALRADSLTRIPILYQKAYANCKTLINLGYNSLNSSFAQVFKNYLQDLYDPKESMFEIAFYYVSVGSSVAGRVGTANCFSINGSSKYKSGNNYLKCTPTYWFSFRNNDIRQQFAGIRDNIDANSYRLCGTLSNLGIAKWRRDWTTISANLVDANSTGINWVLLRYSDVLLMFAEADNYINGPGETGGKAALQLVRARAFSNIITSNPVAYKSSVTDYVDSVYNTGKSGIFNAIVNERSWELGHEGWRKPDLLRWNLLASKIADTKTELVKLANGQGRYSTQPSKMYYRYTISTDSILYSLTTAFTAVSTDQKVGTGNWLVDLNSSYKAGTVNITNITQMTNMAVFANNFVHNRSEILPIAATIVAASPAFKQCPAYKGL